MTDSFKIKAGPIELKLYPLASGGYAVGNLSPKEVTALQAAAMAPCPDCKRTLTDDPFRLCPMHASEPDSR